MDLRAITASPSTEERRAVDAVLGPSTSEGPVSVQEAKRRRTHLLPALHALRERVGWVTPGGLGYVCQRLGIPPAEGFGVASFYAMLPLTPRAPAFAHVCDDVVCRSRGAEGICEQLARRLGPPAAHSERTSSHDDAGKGTPAAWGRSPCLGLCEQAPAALVSKSGEPAAEASFGAATAEKVLAALGGPLPEPVIPVLGSSGPRRLLSRVGKVNPESLDDFRANGGYRALRAALDMGAERVIREVTDARLVGRGGAAFPTGKKWEAVSKAATRTRYVVCNADESEPGTFKDRVLLEGDPFAVLEAMTIAGMATGAERGYLYLRGEYPLAARRLGAAIAAARARGFLGPDILGRGLHFDVELRIGAGAYICGEETALFNSIEGFRGEPRNKPPFPVESGLFGKPTAINNVETLVAVLTILAEGAAAYASVGTAGSPGTKLFCLSGAVGKPGVYEVPFGTRLDQLLELAGGVPEGKRIRAILLGGAAGTFIGPDQLTLPLSFEDTRKAGTTLGSGVVWVLDESVEWAPTLRRIARFFRAESCGQCVPCRVGTVRQDELLARLESGADAGRELALLKELAQAMRDASICGLGQTAASAIESALHRFQPYAGARR